MWARVALECIAVGAHVQNGSKICPHSTEHASASLGYQSSGHSPPAQPEVHASAVLISCSFVNTVAMVHSAACTWLLCPPMCSAARTIMPVLPAHTNSRAAASWMLGDCTGVVAAALVLRCQCARWPDIELMLVDSALLT
eukprot:COSAG05_NODE_340_length_11109_cov_150.755041_6_plen_140_part_00